MLVEIAAGMIIVIFGIPLLLALVERIADFLSYMFAPPPPKPPPRR